MLAGTGSLLRSPTSLPRTPQRPLRRRFDPSFPRFSITALNSGSDYRGPKPKTNLVADWVSNNDDAARSLPIYAGGVSLLAVLFNGTASNIALVADASSSQSRADSLTLGLAVTNILVGLVWLSIRPKSISKVDPEGVECRRMHSTNKEIREDFRRNFKMTLILVKIQLRNLINQFLHFEFHRNLKFLI